MTACSPANANASLYFLKLLSLWGQHFRLQGRWWMQLLPAWALFSRSFLRSYGQHLLPSSCLFRLPSAGLSIWQKHTHAIWSTGFLIVARDKYFYIVCFPVFHWVYDLPAPPVLILGEAPLNENFCKFQGADILRVSLSSEFLHLQNHWAHRHPHFMAILSLLFPPTEIWAFSFILP